VPRVFLGVGANLGDRLATLQRAVGLLAERGVRTVACSRVWATTPLGGPPDQPEFLNVVVEIDPGEMSPTEVLAAANAVEAELGRVREVRWGPRTIDIDVLLWDDLRSEEPALTIPHPRMHERAFVLRPLVEIAPRAVITGRGSAAACLDACKAQRVERMH